MTHITHLHFQMELYLFALLKLLNLLWFLVHPHGNFTVAFSMRCEENGLEIYWESTKLSWCQKWSCNDVRLKCIKAKSSHTRSQNMQKNEIGYRRNRTSNTMGLCIHLKWRREEKNSIETICLSSCMCFSRFRNMLTAPTIARSFILFESNFSKCDWIEKMPAVRVYERSRCQQWTKQGETHQRVSTQLNSMFTAWHRTEACSLMRWEALFVLKRYQSAQSVSSFF